MQTEKELYFSVIPNCVLIHPYLDNLRSWNFTVRTDKTQVTFYHMLIQYEWSSKAGIDNVWMHIFSLQFPYEPDYGDRQSQSSSTAADQLVQEVREEA